MKYAICYVSTASFSLQEADIQEILDVSSKSNIDRSISGILLYSERNFFQVLEGDKEIVKNLYAKIRDDSRHYDIIKIFDKEIPEEIFKGYETNLIFLDSRYKDNELENYLAQIDNLNPSIQTSVKYILKNFAEGIK